MSSKTVDENYKRLRAELDERFSKDKRLTAIADKISKGAADFSDTARYTQIVSKHMSDVIKRNIGELKQPMAKEMVCKELLRDHYELINGVFGEVQVSIDEKLGIHLNPIKPSYPAERVDKWAHSLEDPTVEPSVIERRAASGSENIGNSIHDDCIKENAKVREQAGLDCYLTRDAGGGCCAWCQALEGRYNYADAPDDIFRRHDNCTCTVTYECGKMRQDVWSKRTWEASPEELQARKDAAEAAKPTVNTPEQAKALNNQKQPTINALTSAHKNAIIDTVEKATGVSKGAPMSIDDAVKGANPKYQTDRQYRVNCQRCVQAYELRRRGYDVEALPKPKSRSSINWGNECFVDSKTVAKDEAWLSFDFKLSEADIIDRLNQAPDNSRHIIYACWKSGSSHVFIADKENGIIRYVDPQSGKLDCSSHFSKARENKYGIFRVDDKDITDNANIVKKTVQRS